MNSDIPLETADIFFSREPLIKTVLTRPVRSANRELQMKNSCPQMDSNPVPFAYKSNSLSVCATRSDNYRAL